MVDSNLQWVHSSCSKPWPNKLLERAHISASCVSKVLQGTWNYIINCIITILLFGLRSNWKKPNSRCSLMHTIHLIFQTSFLHQGIQSIHLTVASSNKESTSATYNNNHKSCTCHSSSSYTGYYLWPPLSTIRKEGSPQSHYQPGWAKSITTCHGPTNH